MAKTLKIYLRDKKTGRELLTIKIKDNKVIYLLEKEGKEILVIEE